MCIYVIIIALVIIIGILYYLWSHNKTMTKNEIKKDLQSPKDENKDILREETIAVYNNGQYEDLVLKILEDDGEIKKIDEDISTTEGNTIYSLRGNINAFWGDSDDGPVPGNTIYISNEHVIIEKLIDNIDNSNYYYININNIDKITRKNDYYDANEYEEHVPIAIFTIYTKDHKSLELIYPNDILIPDKNSPMVIKSKKNNILFEYTYDMNREDNNIEYDFSETQLRIEKNHYYHPDEIDNREYETSINYSDITTKDIVKQDSIINVIIKTNYNNDYILVFKNEDMANKFYNELNTK